MPLELSSALATGCISLRDEDGAVEIALTRTKICIAVHVGFGSTATCGVWLGIFAWMVDAALLFYAQPAIGVLFASASCCVESSCSASTVV